MKRILVCLWLAFGPLDVLADQPQGISVADTIAATRIWYDLRNEWRIEDPVRLSPDGRRYLIILTRGDLERNGTWVEFFTGRTDSLAEAAKGHVVVRLFTQEHHLSQLLFQTPFIWLADNERVVFPWNPKPHLGQVLAVNLNNGRTSVLVESPTKVSSAGVSPDGRTVVFTAHGDRAAADSAFRDMVAAGFTVDDSQTLLSLLEGYPSESARERFAEAAYVVGSSDKKPRRLKLDRNELRAAAPLVSPDGRWAVVVARPREIPPHWDQYPLPGLRRSMATQRDNPGQPDTIGQLWLIDVTRGEAKPLWDAPYFPTGVWSPDSRSIVLGHAFLPVHVADDAGLRGEAVAEVSITGEITRIGTPAADETFSAARWRHNGVLELRGDRTDTIVRMRKHGGTWQQVQSPVDAQSGSGGTVRIQVRQDLNTPPSIVAFDPSSGEEVAVASLDPWLAKDRKLGRVEIVRWTDRSNRQWTGKLYYPVNHSPARKYGLVINVAPPESSPIGAAHKFSLRGSEQVPSVLSNAQPLAARHLAVLNILGGPDERIRENDNRLAEYETMREGIQSAAEYFVSSGLIDRDRVGLAGFSRRGSYVLHTLVHSQFPFAAAIAADNINHGYLEYLVFPHAAAESVQIYGGEPRGEGLIGWQQHAPGFNAHRIRAPLLLERDNGGVASVLAQWELYANLKRLQKPVELYLVPDIDKFGSHGLVLPRQQLASLEQAVDWFDFWLNEHEDSASGKTRQYARWRKVRELQRQQADNKVPSG